MSLLGPSEAQARQQARTERSFWAWDNEASQVVPVQGFSTQEDRAWWVPSLGYTMWLGTHLFDDREAAVRCGRSELTDEIATLTKALQALQ
jgi:hypothetical protein